MKILLSLIFLFFYFSEKADEAKMEEWTYINTIDDILSCSTYYFISAMGLERAKDSNSAKVMKHSDELTFMAAYLGEGINLKKETIDSKLELHLKEQLSIIDNDYKNLSLLIVKYAENCKDWYNDNFKTRMLFWVDEYNKRFGE